MEAAAIYHYSPGTEPEGQKLEPHGALPMTWPAFEELATGEVEFFAGGKNDELTRPHMPVRFPGMGRGMGR